MKQGIPTGPVAKAEVLRKPREPGQEAVPKEMLITHRQGLLAPEGSSRATANPEPERLSYIPGLSQFAPIGPSVVQQLPPNRIRARASEMPARNLTLLISHNLCIREGFDGLR